MWLLLDVDTPIFSGFEAVSYSSDLQMHVLGARRYRVFQRRYDVGASTRVIRLVFPHQVLRIVRAKLRARRPKVVGVYRFDTFPLDKFKVAERELRALDLDDDCPICYEPLTGTKHRTVTGCSHVFHTACLTKWGRQHAGRTMTCPVCRTGIPYKPSAANRCLDDDDWCNFAVLLNAWRESRRELAREF